MDRMKCPYLAELKKVTRIERIQVVMGDQGLPDQKKNPSCLGTRSDGVEEGHIKQTTNLEESRERMIKRSPEMASLKDFPPSPKYPSRRYSDVSPSIPSVPKPSNRVMEKLTPHRIQRWSHSFLDLLTDHVGIQMFLAFLEKEFSAENLRFWLACQELKRTQRVNVPKLVTEIFREFLDDDSTSAINVDSKIFNSVKINLTNPSYNIFDEAQEHIFQLMKTDSYPRFIRSEKYKQLLKDSTSKPRKK